MEACIAVNAQMHEFMFLQMLAYSSHIKCNAVLLPFLNSVHFSCPFSYSCVYVGGYAGEFAYSRGHISKYDCEMAFL